MKKIAMTICGVAFISVVSFSQSVDSTINRDGSREINQNGTLNQSTNPQPIQGIPRTQDKTSPTTQPKQQVQPQIQPQPQPQMQSQPPIQSQPELQPQPFQTEPQVPTQTQPTQQNQLNQPEPAPAPTPTDPAGSGTRPQK